MALRRRAKERPGYPRAVNHEPRAVLAAAPVEHDDLVAAAQPQHPRDLVALVRRKGHGPAAYGLGWNHKVVHQVRRATSVIHSSRASRRSTARPAAPRAARTSSSRSRMMPEASSTPPGLSTEANGAGRPIRGLANILGTIRSQAAGRAEGEGGG